MYKKSRPVLKIDIILLTCEQHGALDTQSVYFWYFLTCLMTVSKNIFKLLSFWRDTVDSMPLIESLVLFLRVDILDQFVMFFSTEEDRMSMGMVF